MYLFIASVGIDLGKTTFHLVALDCHAKVILRKKFSRTQLLAYTANLPWSILGMEACSGAHFFAAKLRDQGHEVKLIPGQFVKPFVKTNKNDFNDAEAIAEAVTRQNMRFVPIKTDDQLDLQAPHRVRDRLVHRRTALINQIRGFLLERGIAFPKGPANLRNQMPVILEDAEQDITPRMRRLLADLWQEWKQLEANITKISEEIEHISLGRLGMLIGEPGAMALYAGVAISMVLLGVPGPVSHASYVRPQTVPLLLYLVTFWLHIKASRSDSIRRFQRDLQLLRR